MSKIPTGFVPRDKTRSDEARLNSIFRKQARIAKYGQVTR